MPYKRNPAKPFESMERLLNSYKINAPALARMLGVSVPTARRKLNSPELLTLKDIGLINRMGHIDIEELRAAVRE